MRRVRRDEVVEILDALVVEKGDDYKYTPDVETGNCLYWHGDTDKGEPGCIAGHVFVNLGLPTEVLWMNEGKSARLLASRYHIATSVTFEDDAVDVLCKAQANQDKGHTWKEAVKAAKMGYWLNKPEVPE